MGALIIRLTPEQLKLIRSAIETDARIDGRTANAILHALSNGSLRVTLPTIGKRIEGCE